MKHNSNSCVTSQTKQFSVKMFPLSTSSRVILQSRSVTPTQQCQSSRNKSYFITYKNKDSTNTAGNQSYRSLVILYREGKFSFGGVCLTKQSRELKYRNFSLLATDGEVLATTVW